MKTKIDLDASVWDVPILGSPGYGSGKGDGNPDCTTCKGRGVTEHYSEEGIPETQACRCILKRAVLLNVDRGWKGQALSKAEKVPSSPLLGYENQNVWVTADLQTFRSHMRYVALRQGPSWRFQVSSDADLMTAWLASVAVKGQGILDPDAARVSGQDAQLVDLIDPPELLVIFLGIKAARNAAMNEVLLETLYHRSHINRPTWVVDQPHQPFDPNHLAYSDAARSYLATWKHFTLSGGGALNTGVYGSGVRKTTLPSSSLPAYALENEDPTPTPVPGLGTQPEPSLRRKTNLSAYEATTEEPKPKRKAWKGKKSR